MEKPSLPVAHPVSSKSQVPIKILQFFRGNFLNIVKERSKKGPHSSICQAKNDDFNMN